MAVEYLEAIIFVT